MKLLKLLFLDLRTPLSSIRSGLTAGIVAMIIILWVFGCNGTTPPVIEPPTGLPEIAFKIKLQHQGLGWINPAMIAGADRLDVVVSHWTGHDKWIEAWETPDPGGAAGTENLIWSDDWWSPREYIHYPDCDWCQGPLVAANFTGQKTAEICYLHYRDDKFWLRLVGFEGAVPGNIIKEIALPGSSYDGRPPAHILACNMSGPRGNRYTDVVVVWKDQDVTREMRCYQMPSMTLKWTYRLEHEGYFNRNWGMHRPFITPYPNGKDVVCYGIGIVDWQGKGELWQSWPNHPPQIEFLEPDGTDLGNTQHIDSVCWFTRGTEPPYIVLTQDGREMWTFPDWTVHTKPNGNKYNELRWQRNFQNENVATHTHRLRALAWPWFLATDVYRPDGYHAQIWNAETLNKRCEFKTKQEAERIFWRGEWHILTEYGIYNRKGEKIRGRKGSHLLENNYMADFYRWGHEQYIFARGISGGRYELVGVSDPTAEKQLVPVSVNPNSSFY